MYKIIPVEGALEEHKETVAKLRQVCAEDIAKKPAEFDDDLFLTRFAMSARGNFEKATKAVKQATEFRFKNAEILAKLRAGDKHPDELEMRKYMCFSEHKTLKDGSPVMCMREALGNPSLCLEKLKPEQIKNAIIFQKEQMYAICDAETRRRGVFVKMVSIVDCSSLGLSSFNRGFMSVAGEGTKEMELVYPQLLGKMNIISPPWFLSMIWPFVQLVVPASTLEKLQFCKGSLGEDIMKCPVASKYIALEDLPTFVGGKCQCVEFGGCIAGVPNSQSVPLTGDNRDMKEFRMMRLRAKIELKEKQYAFRVRVLVNGIALSSRPGAREIDEEFVTATQQQKTSVEMAALELGPYVESSTNPKMETLHFLMQIEKLADASDPSKGILDKKEKASTVEVSPFKEATMSINFGESADVTLTVDPFVVLPSSSPLWKKIPGSSFGSPSSSPVVLVQEQEGGASAGESTPATTTSA